MKATPKIVVFAHCNLFDVEITQVIILCAGPGRRRNDACKSKAFKNRSVSVRQGCQTGGPRAKSGPQRFRKWPAGDSQSLTVQAKLTDKLKMYANY